MTTLSDAADLPDFMLKIRVRGALRGAFRGAKTALQKRNVSIRGAFRGALLTLLEAHSRGKRV